MKLLKEMKKAIFYQNKEVAMVLFVQMVINLIFMDLVDLQDALKIKLKLKNNKKHKKTVSKKNKMATYEKNY